MIDQCVCKLCLTKFQDYISNSFAELDSGKVLPAHRYKTEELFNYIYKQLQSTF